MEKELFGAIRDNYYKASDELWYWFKYSNTFIKIIFFPWIIIASSLMKIIGFIFSLGVILDKLSVLLQQQRTKIITIIENSSNNLIYNKSSYIISPLVGIILFPIALFLGVIPKWSSTLAVSISPDELDLNVGTGIEHGYFIQLGKQYLDLSKELFVNINEHGFFFGIIALVISIVTAPIILTISLLFFFLIILDLFGWLVSMIRKFVVSSSQSMANKSGDNAVFTILMPALLTLFVPLYLFLLLIPKIATHEMNT